MMLKIHAADCGLPGAMKAVWDSSSGISCVPEAAPCAVPARDTRVCAEPAPWSRAGKHSLPGSHRVLPSQEPETSGTAKTTPSAFISTCYYLFVY